MRLVIALLLLPFLLAGQTVISSNAIMDTDTPLLTAPCAACSPWRYSRQDSTLRRWDYAQLRWERVPTEDQVLSISNDTLFLTNGGFAIINLPDDLQGVRDSLDSLYYLVSIDTLPNTSVTPGSYTYSSITVDQKGRLTSASSGTTPVTSVGLSMPPQFSTGPPVSSTGNLTATWLEQIAGTILAGPPSGSDTFPVFRRIVSNDLDAGVVGSTQLASTSVTAGDYSFPNITIDADGRATAATNGVLGYGLLGANTSGSPLRIFQGTSDYLPKFGASGLESSFVQNNSSGTVFFRQSVGSTNGWQITNTGSIWEVRPSGPANQSVRFSALNNGGITYIGGTGGNVVAQIGGALSAFQVNNTTVNSNILSLVAPSVSWGLPRPNWMTLSLGGAAFDWKPLITPVIVGASLNPDPIGIMGGNQVAASGLRRGGNVYISGGYSIPANNSIASNGSAYEANTILGMSIDSVRIGKVGVQKVDPEFAFDINNEIRIGQSTAVFQPGVVAMFPDSATLALGTIASTVEYIATREWARDYVATATSRTDSAGVYYYNTLSDMKNASPHSVGQVLFISGRNAQNDGGEGFFRVTNSGKATDGGTVFTYSSTNVVFTDTVSKSFFSSGMFPNTDIEWGSFYMQSPGDSTTRFTDPEHFYGHGALDEDTLQVINYKTGIFRNIENISDLIDVSGQVEYGYTYTNSSLRLERIFDGKTYKAEWFGLIADDTTFNNSPYIGSALNSIQINQGKVLTLDPKEYSFFSTITIPDGVSIVGDNTVLSVMVDIVNYWYTEDSVTFPRRSLQIVAYQQGSTMNCTIRHPNNSNYFSISGIEFDGNSDYRLYVFLDSAAYYPNMKTQILDGGYYNCIKVGNERDTLKQWFLNDVHIHDYFGNLLLQSSESYAPLTANNLTFGNSVWNHWMYTVKGHVTNLIADGYSGNSFFDVGDVRFSGFNVTVRSNPTGGVGDPRLFALRNAISIKGRIPLENMGVSVDNFKIEVVDIAIYIAIARSYGFSLTDGRIKTNAAITLAGSLANAEGQYRYNWIFRNIAIECIDNGRVGFLLGTSTNQNGIVFEDISILQEDNYTGGVTTSGGDGTIFNLSRSYDGYIRAGEILDFKGLTKDSLSGHYLTVDFIDNSDSTIIFWYDVTGSDSAPALGSSVAYRRINISSTTTPLQVATQSYTAIDNESNLYSGTFTEISDAAILAGYWVKDSSVYISMTTSKTGLNRGYAPASVSRTPQNITVRNVHWPTNATAQNLIRLNTVDTMGYSINVVFDNVTFPRTLNNSIVTNEFNSTAISDATFSFYDNYNIKFNNCTFRYITLAGGAGNYRSPYVGFNLFNFQDCQWRNLKVDDSELVLRDGSKRNRRSNTSVTVNYTATGGETFIDVDSELIFEPHTVNTQFLSATARNKVDYIEITNTRKGSGGDAGYQSFYPIYRIHFNTALTASDAIQLKINGAVSNGDFNYQTRFLNFFK